MKKKTKNELTPAEWKLMLAFIWLNHQKGYPPSYREICELCGYKSINSVTKLVKDLTKKGYLNKDKKGKGVHDTLKRSVQSNYRFEIWQ